MRLVLILGLLVTVPSCGSDEPAVDPNAPDIVSFSTSVQPLFEDGMVTFTAVVTDLQGPSNILSGTLKSSSSVASYGSFTAVSPGSYSLAVTWAAIQGVQAINGTKDGEAREFVAEFIDLEGHKGIESLTLTLDCPALTVEQAPCNGVCEAIESDRQNCGGCGLTCPNASPDPLSPFSYCMRSLCQEVHLKFAERISCDQACASRGGACDHDNVGCPGQQCDLEEQSYAIYSNGNVLAPLANCSAVPAATIGADPFTELGCNCKDLPAM